MNSAERTALRAAVDAAKRARLAVAEADEDMPAAPPPWTKRCPYCGTPTRGATCAEHRVLLRVEKQLLGEAA